MTFGRGLILAGTVIGVGAVSYRHWSSPISVVGLVGAVIVLGVLADIDVRTLLLPNRIVGPFAAATFIWLGVAAFTDGDVGRFVAAGFIGLLWALALAVGSSLGQIGMGDVKLVFPIGMIVGWLGMSALVTAVVVTLASSVLVGVGLWFRHRGTDLFSTLPYGPFLALGAVAGMIV